MSRSLLPVLCLALAASACAQPGSDATTSAPVAAAPGTEVARLSTEAGTVVVTEIASGFDHPWGLAFLPDGRLLVTERAGSLRIVGTDGSVSGPVQGVPEVATGGQGGLLDVVLAPDFETSRHVYLAYSRPGRGGSATALGRGVLDGDRLTGFETLFTQVPFHDNGFHFGGRIAFSPDGRYVFLSMGERNLQTPAQDLSNHQGTVVRLYADGSVPEDNPFVDREGAQPEIWTYGHRNAEGLAVHPVTGDLWEGEFGPRGGDELNRIVPGTNYGWPLVSWGVNYNGTPIPDPPTRPDLTDAVRQWTPVISPSGMAFYTGGAVPEWMNDLFIGGLSSQALVRLVIDGGAVAHEERIPMGARIRDVTTGPDGALYVSTDDSDGAIWRLMPEGE